MSVAGRVPIAVSDLIKSYAPGRPKAVDGVSFKVNAGEIFGLLGPNGAGKTTTIKTILGLILPTSGSIGLAGFEMPSQRHKALRHSGAVLEGARNIYWRLSARANLQYFGALRGLRGKRLAQRTDEVLALVELSDRAREETRHLSRGMQQKVALAVAVLHEPDVLLLDEPTLGLDVQSSRAIERVVRELADEQQKAVLLTTHQMALAERLCDRVYVIDKGKKLAEGPTADVIKQFGGEHQTVEIQLGNTVDADALARLREAFPRLSATAEGETTTLSWPDCASQGELLRLLSLLDAEGCAIVNVGRRQATLEEVFVLLTYADQRSPGRPA